MLLASMVVALRRLWLRRYSFRLLQCRDAASRRRTDAIALSASQRMRFVRNNDDAWPFCRLDSSLEQDPLVAGGPPLKPSDSCSVHLNPVSSPWNRICSASFAPERRFNNGFRRCAKESSHATNVWVKHAIDHFIRRCSTTLPQPLLFGTESHDAVHPFPVKATSGPVFRQRTSEVSAPSKPCPYSGPQPTTAFA